MPAAVQLEEGPHWAHVCTEHGLSGPAYWDLDDREDDAESGPSDTEVLPLEVVGDATVAAAKTAAEASPWDSLLTEWHQNRMDEMD